MNAAATKDETRFFCECRRCGERWLIATGFVELSELARQAKKIRLCPNCNAGPKECFLCPTSGKHAATEPQQGKPMQKLGGDHVR